MTPRLWLIAGALVLCFALGFGIPAGCDAYRQRHANASEVTAHIAEGEAQTHEAQARATDPKIQDLEAKVDSQAKQLARVQGERDVLLKKWNARPIPVQSSSNAAIDDRSELLAQLDLAQAVIEKDAEEIAKQDLLIKNQSELILVATKRGDEWKATAEARERQALAQEAATAAWKKAVTSSKWVGRAEGFAAGIAIGYVGGRR